MWGKRSSDGQPYIKFKKPMGGISGAGHKTEAVRDVHMKERENETGIMHKFEGAQVIVPVPELELWMVWFGGESHYVHIYNNFGQEMDVFSWGFEKNKLDEKDVRKHIKEHIEELKNEAEEIR